MIRVFLADLLHDNVRYRAFPYGVGCVGSFAQSRLGNKIRVEVFRSPDAFADALISQTPEVVGFSNYVWNSSLTLEFVRRVKEHAPHIVTVMGGPNYPTDGRRQYELLSKNDVLDFYIESEGEVPFAELLDYLIHNDLDVPRLKRDKVEIAGCHYVSDGKLVNPAMEMKIRDLNEIPSPYLTGLFNKFFKEGGFIPLTQSKRGCPFKCTFCVEGLPYYNKLGRSSVDRFLEELEYIARRITTGAPEWDAPALILGDANFGMYKEDLQMCEQIAKVQEQYDWPRTIDVSSGKNKKSQIIEAARITNGAFRPCTALQSTDVTTLANVKRSNISDTALFEAARDLKDSGQRSYTELILGLPGDTKESHIQSIETVVNAGIDQIQVYPLVLLPGTEVESPESRDRFGIKTKYRILANCYGIYRFDDYRFPWGEAVEHVVETDTMSFEDYLYCTRLQLSVEIFYSGSYFEEFIGLLRHLNLPVMSFIQACHQLLGEAHRDLQFLYEERDTQVLRELWDTKEECMKCVQNENSFHEYQRNVQNGSLANQKARAILEHSESLHAVARKAMIHCLIEAGLDTSENRDYIDQVSRFSFFRKNDIANTQSDYRESFDYAFQDMLNEGFTVDPTGFRVRHPVRYLFAHDVEQTQKIRDIVNGMKDPIQRMRALVYPNVLQPMSQFFRKPQSVE